MRNALPVQVAELERQVALGCKAGTAMLVDRLAQAPATAGADSAAPVAEGSCAGAGAAAEPLQTRLCAWLGGAFEALQSRGVASSSSAAQGCATGAAANERGAGSDDESSQGDSEASDDDDGEAALRAPAGNSAAVHVRYHPSTPARTRIYNECW